MTSWSLILGLLFLLQPKPVPGAPVPDSAADTVTLKDGTVVLGQIAEAPPRGMFLMYVRRAWVEAALREQAKRWEAATSVELKRAYQARRDRLAAWKRERTKPAAPDDSLGRWLDKEVARFEAAGDPPPAPLLIVGLRRVEIKSVVRRPKARARMLRQGWLMGFRDVESTLKLVDLKEALAGRGVAADAGNAEPIVIDQLLPVLPETDDQWLARRAATEVTHETGLRFIQFQNLVAPRDAPRSGRDPGYGACPDRGIASPPYWTTNPSIRSRHAPRKSQRAGAGGGRQCSPAGDQPRVRCSEGHAHAARSAMVRTGRRPASTRPPFGPTPPPRARETTCPRTRKSTPPSSSSESIGFGLPADAKQQSPEHRRAPPARRTRRGPGGVRRAAGGDGATDRGRGRRQARTVGMGLTERAIPCRSDRRARNGRLRAKNHFEVWCASEERFKSDPGLLYNGYAWRARIGHVDSDTPSRNRRSCCAKRYNAPRISRRQFTVWPR